ncbi:MAG: toll/interleukin-1 receptor domain-containing protein [Anaerolineae bacterium]
MQIFISYSRVDKDFAVQLATFLNTYDLTVWLDVSNIPHGANWDMEVQRGLDSSDTMLVLLSPDSVASENVADEWSYFINKDKPIIPLLVRPCEVPFRLQRRQRVNFTGDQREALGQLIRALGSPKPKDPDETQRVTTLPFGQSPAVVAPSPADSLRPPSRTLRPTQRPDVARFAVIWNGHYDWYNGLRGGMDGELLINGRELLLVPREAPLLSIPLASLTGVKVQRGLDSRVLLQYRGADGNAQNIVLMGATRKNRKALPAEIMQAIKTVTGRQDL